MHTEQAVACVYYTFNQCANLSVFYANDPYRVDSISLVSTQFQPLSCEDLLSFFERIINSENVSLAQFFCSQFNTDIY